MIPLRLYDFYLLAVLALIETARRLKFLSPDKWIALLPAGLAFLASFKKRQLIENNLTRAFGEPADRGIRRKVVYQIFFSFWSEMLEWAHEDDYFAPRATVQGIAHLENALARGKGVILWESSGFGKRNATQAILNARGFRVTPIHAYRHLGGISAGDERDSWVLVRLIRPYFDRRERRRVNDIIYLPRDTSLAFTRTLLEQLTRNGILCVAFDGPTGQKRVSIEFLGQQHAFATGIPNLAKLSGAALIPIFCTPRGEGQYTLDILPALSMQPQASGTAQTPIEDYAKQLETRIRAHPEWYRHWDLVGSPPVNAGARAVAEILRTESIDGGT